MKGELITVNNKLGFFVKRSDIRTKADKQAICDFIKSLYETYASSWVKFTIEDLEEELERGKKEAYVGFIMDDSDFPPDLEFKYLTKKNFEVMKKIAEGLSESEDAAY